MAKPASPTRPGTAVAGRIAPQGERLARPAGPGTLYPAARLRCIKEDKLIFCGEIGGFAFAYSEHPNNKDPKKISIRFMGDFVVVPAPESGMAQSRATECYFPGVVERALKAQLAAGMTNIPVAVEVWAEPDSLSRPTAPTAMGFQYAVYNRRPATADDPMFALMRATGIGVVPPLALAAPAPAESVDHDPETGEVIPKTADAA